MYHASELFIIKDVLDIYTQQKQNNECMLSTLASSQSQQMLVNQKVNHKLLPCTFAMYDCRQLEDVFMVTEILYQIIIRCCHLHLLS